MPFGVDIKKLFLENKVMNRQLKELILAVFLGFVLICLMPSNLIAGVELNKAADYFKQVAELVIKRDRPLL